jgi:hypothetical protein
MLSSVYYGLFLGIYVAAAAAIALLWHVSRRAPITRYVAGAAVAGVVAILVSGPYLIPYSQVRAHIGGRDVEEIQRYSATPIDYVRPAPQSRLIGKPTYAITEERTLIPGYTTFLLAAGALWPPAASVAVLYGALAAVAFDVSLGMNGVSFRLLRSAVPPLNGLRAPARFGALTLLSLAVLASIGAARWMQQELSLRWRWVPFAALALLTIEFWPAEFDTQRPPARTSEYQWLAAQPRDVVVLELPTPHPSRLWGAEPEYQYASLYHWRRLVNGYSGYAPRQYLELLPVIANFPDQASIAAIRNVGVDLIFVHQRHLSNAEYASFVNGALRSTDLKPVEEFGTVGDRTFVFALRGGRATSERR